MRSKEEIEVAIRHLRDSLEGAGVVGVHTGAVVALANAQIEALEWTLGRAPEFTALLADMEAIDNADNN